MTLTVRRANAEDAHPIARLHVLAWHVAYPGLLPADYLEGIDLEARFDSWRSMLSAGQDAAGVPSRTFVAESEDLVVGFATVGCFREEPENTSTGELWAMYVHPDRWRTGIGDALMAATFTELERLGATSSYLWVLEGNDRAMRFYERHGWQSDNVAKSFDTNGVEVRELRFSVSRIQQA